MTMKKTKRKADLIRAKTIYLTDAEFKDLKRLSENEGLTISNFIRKLKNEYDTTIYNQIQGNR